ncbi:MAG: beta strand repeat-containing protein [Bacillota bacterium]
MKKLLALLLALTLTFSMLTVAFADEEIGAEAATCEALGMLQGAGDGVTAEYLATAPTRIQAAVMFLRLKGLEEEAKAFEAEENFADADQADWAKNIMAYLYANPDLGWVGDGVNFNPQAQVTAQMYYKVMLEALGYKQNTADVAGDFEWAEVFEFAAEVGLVAVADVEEFTVNDIAVATVEALGATVNGEETTLAEKLVAEEIIDGETALELGIVISEEDKALNAAVAAAEAAIAALPAEITLELKTDVEAARALVADALALNAEAVVSNVDVLEAAEAKIVELEAAAAKAAAVAALETNFKAVVAVTNTIVDVTFTEAVTVADAEHFVVKDAAGTALAVSATELAADGKKITLTTPAQTTGAAYTLTIGATSKSFVGGIADTTAPTAVSAASVDNKTVDVTFTDANRLDVASATNVANYTIAGLTVESAAVAGKVVTLTTSAQTSGTVYTVSVVGVKDVAGNAITSAKTATFAGKAADVAAPSAITVVPYSNTQVRVDFTDSSKIEEESAENVANYTIAGLTVSAAELLNTDSSVTTYGGTKSKSVLLTTTAQTTGTVYTVSVLGVKDVAGNAITTAKTNTFAGKAADTAAPSAITAVPYTNTQVRVDFTDSSNIDEESAENVANYTIAGLTVTAAELLNTTTLTGTYGGTINKSVILTTTAQTTGTVYTVSVLGVKDVAGNAITTAKTNTFAGKAADTTAPTVAVTPVAGNKVQLVFTDASAMDATSVQTLTNYSISTLGYPVSVDSWTASTKTLVLNTAAQTNGTVYEITINNVKDAAGNTITANTKKSFAGIGSALDAVAISSVTALNNRQIQVVFNKDVVNVDADGSDFKLKKGTAAAVDFESIDAGATTAVTKIDAKTYILTIDTTAANHLTNDVYTLIVDGDDGSVIADLGGTAISTTDATKCEKAFGGVTDAPATPEVVAITHTGLRQVEVIFNREVKLANFGLASNVTITYDPSITINLGGTAVATYAVVDSTDKKKVTFTFAGDIAADKVAKLNILAADFDKITDITGNIAMVKNATTNYEVNFGTVAYTSEAIKVTSVTAVDEQTLEIAFNQAIVFTNQTADITDANFATITRVDGTTLVSGTDYNIMTAYKTASDKIRVYFKSLTTKMADGLLYDFTFVNHANGDGLVKKATDLTTELDATVTANAKGTFGYNPTANAAPYLVSVTPLADSRIQLTFSEDLSAAPTTSGASTDIEIWNGSTQIAAGNLSDATAIGTSKSQYYIDLTGGKFMAGTTYTVRIPNANDITDTMLVDTIKKASASDATLNSVTFGGIATAATAPTATDLAFINNVNAAGNAVKNVVSTAGLAQNAYKTLEVYVGTTAPTADTAAEYTFDLTGAAINAGAATALTAAGGATVAAADTVYYRFIDNANSKSAWVADGTIAATPTATLNTNTYVLANATKYSVAGTATVALSVDSGGTAYTVALADTAGADSNHLSIINKNADGNITYVDYLWVETVVSTLETPVLQ